MDTDGGFGSVVVNGVDLVLENHSRSRHRERRELKDNPWGLRPKSVFILVHPWLAFGCSWLSSRACREISAGSPRSAALPLAESNPSLKAGLRTKLASVSRVPTGEVARTFSIEVKRLMAKRNLNHRFRRPIFPRCASTCDGMSSKIRKKS